jgi:TonB family protein
VRQVLLLLAMIAVPARALEPEVTHFPDLASERAPLNTVVPAYPDRALSERIEGDVQVCFKVDRKGKPYRIAVRRSTHRVFEKPSRRAVRASTYKPLPEGQKDSGIKTCRTFRFRLEPIEVSQPDT